MALARVFHQYPVHCRATNGLLPRHTHPGCSFDYSPERSKREFIPACRVHVIPAVHAQAPDGPVAARNTMAFGSVPGLRAMEKCITKSFETTSIDSLPNATHQILEIMQVVQRIEARTQDLTAFVEMSQVGP